MKCLALFSGGLDSMLSIKLITEQNIEVHALNIDIGFGGDSDKNALMEKRANLAGASFESINIREKYLKEVLFSPKYGYGKHFNPCIDCHGFMFKTALDLLTTYKADFVISGEVIGQRPMSQRKEALNQVKKIANSDLILRPLCAKLLPPTLPEIQGWVDRDKLLDISGRGRSRQLDLAKKFGFDDFESPAGGCPLTTEVMSNRIKDFIKFDKQMNANDFQILRFGRHLRLPDGAKLIIGRDESENNILKKLKSDKFQSVNILNLIGAFVLISKQASLKDQKLAAKLAAAYAKSKFDQIYQAQIGENKFEISPINKEEAKQYFVG